MSAAVDLIADFGVDTSNVSIGAVYGRLSVGKGFFERSAVAGWCGHVSDLDVRPFICRWP